ncbi:heme ABC transporter ATP-binding protein [Leptospira idonii]|uniref:Heme ABC transporter ATP-binding protein n=1 Tax=Leptospira idonii TaxID=1193500 RepID=A0A4R9M0J7_9LEPT|nr:heme ABC transporter ATP-binding protein [Leptospira idonii]TGN20244.1 heme ABC transporter ATP-binding protein [Leptospira idonii]
MSLIAENVTYSVGSKNLVSQISLEVKPGELHVLMGRNGAGKSTMFKLLCGDFEPTSGEILLNGKPIREWKRKHLAMTRSVLTQDYEMQFPFSAREIVELGRSPYQSTKEENDKVIFEAMEITNTQKLGDRSYSTLSGGEKQRTQYSRVLSQVWGNPPKYLLLDEPISSMDLPNQLKLLQVSRHMADQGYGLLLILHDINFANQYADTVSLLKEGKLAASGKPKDVLTEKNISDIFGVEMNVFDSPNGIFILPKLSKMEQTIK